MKIYGTSGAGGRMLGFLMIPWLLALVPMFHHLDLSDVGAWLSMPLAVGVAYTGRVIKTHLVKENPECLGHPRPDC